jgi:hypothetical protein
MQQVIRGEIGKPAKPIVTFTATGLILGDLTVVVIDDGTYIADPETDLGLTLTEVASAPGFYELSLTPRTEGILYIKATHTSGDNEVSIQSSLGDVTDDSIFGDYTLTVTDGTTPIQNVLARVFDASGVKQLTLGYTDALGNVTFSLPVGTYLVRLYREGFTLPNAIIVVQANDSIAPVLREVLPDTGSIGDTITLLGDFFGDSGVEVLFGAEATVSPALVNASQTALTVVVPALTGAIFSMRVQKDDPSGPGKLVSNAVTFTRV